jgi:hypothetical protein
MLEYQKSHGRRTALGPDPPVFLRLNECEQPVPAALFVHSFDNKELTKYAI